MQRFVTDTPELLLGNYGGVKLLVIDSVNAQRFYVSIRSKYYWPPITPFLSSICPISPIRSRDPHGDLFEFQSIK
jgi:hypothetical protein